MSLESARLLNPRGMWCPTLDPQGVAVENVSNDLSVNSNFGLFYGGASYLEDEGPCFNFDGIDGYVGLVENLVIPNAGSVQTWAKYLGNGPGGNMFFSADTPAGGSGRCRFSASAGNWEVSLASVNAANTGFDLTDGLWHHLLMTWDGTTDLLAYADGTQVFSTPVTSNLLPGAASLPKISGYNIQAGHYWNGRVDDVRLWPKRLSADDVSELYNGGRGYVKPWLPLGGEVGAWIPTISGDTDAGDNI